MPSIVIDRVGTSDLSALKRNFGNLLQEKFGEKRIPTFKEVISARGLVEPKVRSVKFWNSRKLADRSKVWPGSKVSERDYNCRSYFYAKPSAELKALLSDMNQTSDAAAYVRAWTILNHLKEV